MHKEQNCVAQFSYQLPLKRQIVIGFRLKSKGLLTVRQHCLWQGWMFTSSLCLTFRLVEDKLNKKQVNLW